MTGPDAHNSTGASAPHENPDVWAPRLTRVLDRQIDLYTRIERLASRQADLVQTDRPDELLGLLAERQGLVEQITVLNHELEPFTRRWDELVRTLPEGHRDEISSRTGRLGELIAAISKRDEADRLALQSRRDQVAGEINSISARRSAIAAYAPKAGAGARFQDREG